MDKYRKTYKRNSHTNNQITKEQLTNKIQDAAAELADLLVNGYQLELSTSRKGFQVYKMRKSHHVINKSMNHRQGQES